MFKLHSLDLTIRHGLSGVLRRIHRGIGLRVGLIARTFAPRAFIAFAVWLAVTLWVGCSVGQPRENQYGPPPINPNDSPAVLVVVTWVSWSVTTWRAASGIVEDSSPT